MISIIKQDKQNGTVLLRGLSTDVKPTGVLPVETGEITLANGSEFECVNTGERFLYDAENENWYQVTNAVPILGLTSLNGSVGSVTTELLMSGNGNVTIELLTRGDDTDG